MSLCHYDVTQQLREHINDFLRQPHTFAQLKSVLVAQKPIAEVHQALVLDIKRTADQEQAVRKKEIIEEILSKQRAADERDEVAERLTEQRNQIRERELFGFLIEQNRRYTDLCVQTQSAELNLAMLDGRAKATAYVHVAGSFYPPIHNHHTTFYSPGADTQIMLLTSQLQHLRQETARLKKSIDSAHNELSSINTAKEQQIKARSERDKRGNAQRRWNHKAAQAIVQEALSAANYSYFCDKLRQADEATERTVTRLISHALEKNLVLFMEQLESSITVHGCSKDEQEALRNIISLIRQAHSDSDKSARLEADLCDNTRKISSQQSHLTQAKARVIELQKILSELSTEHLKLDLERILATQKQKKNHTAHDHLVNLTVLSVAIAVIGCLPLALALNGIFISVFTSSSLMSTLPTASVSVSALLSIVSISSAFSIKREQKMGDERNKKIADNEQLQPKYQKDLQLLNTVTIPQYEASIRNYEQANKAIQESIESHRSLAKAVLDKALEYTPDMMRADRSSYKSSPDSLSIFKPQPEPSAPRLPTAPPAPLVVGTEDEYEDPRPVRYY